MVRTFMVVEGLASPIYGRQEKCIVANQMAVSVAVGGGKHAHARRHCWPVALASRAVSFRFFSAMPHRGPHSRGKDERKGQALREERTRGKDRHYNAAVPPSVD